MNHAIPTKRFWRRWALVWVLPAIVVMPIGLAVVAVWVPYHRTQSLIRYAESVGGEVRTAVIVPGWLTALPLNSLPAPLDEWLSDAAAELFDTPTVVDLEETSTDDAGLAHLSGLTNLQGLYLDGTQVSDTGLAHLAGLTSLEVLYLAGTQVSDAGLAHLAGLTSLGVLYLGGTQVSDLGLVHIRGLTSLEYLELASTRVSDAGLAHLAGLTSLEGLYLKGTQVSDAGLVHLSGLTNLRSLLLINTKVTDAGVSELRQALPNTDIVWDESAAPKQ